MARYRTLQSCCDLFLIPGQCYRFTCICISFRSESGYSIFAQLGLLMRIWIKANKQFQFLKNEKESTIVVYITIVGPGKPQSLQKSA